MSFRLRLILTISLLVSLSFGLGGTALISASTNDALQTETEAALDSFRSIQSTLYLLNSLGEQTNYRSLSSALEKMEQQNAVSCQALRLNAGSVTLYQSGGAAAFLEELPIPQEGQCVYLPLKDDMGHGLLVSGILPAGSEDLLLTVRFDLSDVYAARKNQQRMYFIIYLLVVYVGTNVAVVLSDRLTKPLRRLARAVRRISEGDLSTRSRILGEDEFGQLSHDFDAMADLLQENILCLEEDVQRRELFMGAFAHELKTPMTSIIGYADFLRQASPDDNTRMLAANYIFSEGKRLEKLSFQLLELLLLKNDSLELREVSLQSFLKSVELSLSPLMKKRNVNLICRGDNRLVTMEPDLVKSLLYNLIDNASKAMEEGGVVAVKGTVMQGGCRIQVADNGRGMEQEELNKITEAFYRVDKSRSRQQGGAGLGLTLCREIVRLHNGSMQFYSVPGTGTRVTVTLRAKAVEP